MSTRWAIAALTVAGVALATSQSNLAAVYVAIGVGAIIYLLHAIEFKINKLLDERNVRVFDDQISKD